MRRFVAICMLLAVMLANPSAFCQSPKGLRVVSLAPSTTEILFALGLDNEIVGVSQYCNFPKRALTKEQVGSMSQPNIERILALKPDIVFSTGLEQAPIVAKMHQLNIKVFVSDPSSIEELYRSMEDMGALVGRGKEAALVIRRMKADIDDIKSKVSSIPIRGRPKVFLEVWNNPIMTAGRGSYIDDLITIAGGINIAGDIRKPYSYFSAEEVIKRNPDCIIMGYMDRSDGRELTSKRFGWASISAVKNGRVYNDIDPDIIFRPGPRVVEGVREIHKRLYQK
jgi:iron complex transport system substrate-binding protein